MKPADALGGTDQFAVFNSKKTCKEKAKATTPHKPTPQDVKPPAKVPAKPLPKTQPLKTT